MWELIQSNRRRSLLLFACMGLFLLLTGYVLGRGLLESSMGPVNSGLFGLALACAVWLLLSLVSYAAGDQILLAVSGAREITHEMHPVLFNVVEEMKLAASLPVMPRIYVIDEEAPNAFATGRSPKRSAIAVTAGLLTRLNRDELQGVIAHEMSHILNRDVLLLTYAGVMLGTVVFISDVFWRSMRAGGTSRARVRTRSGGGGNAVFLVVAVAFALLAPLAARLLYLAISRRREYLADASAVRLTRYPLGLAGALEKIGGSSEPMESVNSITAAMFIVNPLHRGTAGLDALTSTHPPIQERVKVLRALAGNASLVAYQEAFNRVTGRGAVVPPSGLADMATVAVREATMEASTPPSDTGRATLDLMRALNQFSFLECGCGTKIKVPPDYHKPVVTCPRCGRQHPVPAAGAGESAVTPGTPMQEYTRTTKGWESFSCSCGRLLQLSPSFMASHVVCGACGRSIRILGGAT